MRCAESSVNSSNGSGVARARMQAPSRNSASREAEAPASTHRRGAGVSSCAVSNAASTRAAASASRIITSLPRRRRRRKTRRRQKSRRHRRKTRRHRSLRRPRTRPPPPPPPAPHRKEEDVSAAPFPGDATDHEHDEKKDEEGREHIEQRRLV